MRCSHCGAVVPEGETTCLTCGMSVDASAENAADASFSPGPSFSETPAPATAELPSWLQNFGESATEGEAPVFGAAMASQQPRDEPALPGWLQSPRTAPPAAAPAPRAEAPPVQQAASAVPQQPLLSSSIQQTEPAPSDQIIPRPPTPSRLDSIDGDSFFSEDDLPEWLRALNTEAAGGEAPTAFATTSGGSVPVDAVTPPSTNGVIVVPAVTNVWLTEMDGGTVSPGAALFAAVANSAEDRPEALGADAPRELATAGAGRAAKTVEDTGTEKAGSRRLRLYLLAAVLILVILLFVVLNSVR